MPAPRQNRAITCLLLAGVVVVPLVFYAVASTTSGPVTELNVRSIATVFPTGKLKLESVVMPNSSRDVRPRITNVNICDLDADGTNDIICCDAVRHTVWHLKSAADGSWSCEQLVPVNSVAGPTHTEVCDLDGDGDQDIVVAGLQTVWPTDARIGKVVLLENEGSGNYSVRVLAEDLRRVTDVQPADFDGDGDLDLAVAEFGYFHGRLLWLENKGDLKFADHQLLSLPGAIHVPAGDYDNDGDPDIAVVVSQNNEEVWIFENTGTSTFDPVPHRIWTTTNFDLGLSGMVKCDLDQDGDEDFLLSAGDNLELFFPCPQPSHGCLWLENEGDFQFVPHRIASLGGTYAADAADMDADGDMDVVLVSMFNDWKTPGSTSLAWLENDGNQNFTSWHLASKPTHLCTVACGDLNSDGLPDVVTGSLQIFPPYATSPAGVAVWLNAGSGSNSGKAESP